MTNSESILAERAVLSVMADWPLKQGQMLLLGPRSVAILGTRDAYKGVLPDLFVYERKEWARANT